MTRRARQFLRLIRNRAVSARRGLRHVPSSAFVHPDARVSRDLQAGEYAFVGAGCKIDPGVRIGRYAMLASEVTIVGDDHVWDVPGVPMQFTGRPPQQNTLIGDDVWIGYGSLVMRGVTIGRGAIVAAHSVVTRNVPAFQVVAGVPARQIGVRFPEEADRLVHERMLDGATVSPHFAGKLSAADRGRIPEG